MYTDEYVSTSLFHLPLGAKLTGTEAAVGGALAGLFAQAVTTPVSDNICYICYIAF